MYVYAGNQKRLDHEGKTKAPHVSNGPPLKSTQNTLIGRSLTQKYE